MNPDYKNWVPKGMMTGFAAGSAVLGTTALGLGVMGNGRITKAAAAMTGLGAVGCGAWALWCAVARDAFSYDGERQLSRQIVEGTAAFIALPAGGTCLDVGCGSGALTIAVAKRNLQGRVIGCDKWGPEYASFNKSVCESNALAEGVDNTQFMRGDAVALPFPDESFDAVTSNYVYHNIAGHNKQALLRETLRVLKKGGSFAIHDLMEPARYGDMDQFVRDLLSEGYEDVRLIPTAKGMFMSEAESRLLFLHGSTLLVGKK